MLTARQGQSTRCEYGCGKRSYRHLRPLTPLLDIANRRGADVVLPGEDGVPCPDSKLCLDLPNLLFRQHGPAVRGPGIDAAEDTERAVPVLQGCARRNMSIVAAPPMYARARPTVIKQYRLVVTLMVQLHTFRNWAVLQGPGDHVNEPAIAVGHAKAGITI